MGNALFSLCIERYFGFNIDRGRWEEGEEGEGNTSVLVEIIAIENRF